MNVTSYLLATLAVSISCMLITIHCHLARRVAAPERPVSMLAPRKTLHSTPLRVFSGALELLHVNAGDVLYDVGCGDGRLVVRAAQTHGIRAVGIEIDRERVLQARRAAQEAGVAHLVTIHHGNALDFDFADATIVFLFLIERGLRCGG